MQTNMNCESSCGKLELLDIDNPCTERRFHSHSGDKIILFCKWCTLRYECEDSEFVKTSR